LQREHSSTSPMSFPYFHPWKPAHAARAIEKSEDWQAFVEPR
jgi:hypothetical protein